VSGTLSGKTTMARKRKKRTPEDEAYFRWRKEAAARLERVYEIVEKGLAELKASKAQPRRESP
jgi:hypothetical protein